MRSAPRHGLVAVLAIALLTISRPASASIRVVTDSALAAGSAVAVQGRVVAIDGRWDPAADAIYSYVTVDVWRAWGRTDLPSRIVLKQLGGQVGDVELRIGGQASFALDEEVVVFLDIRPRDGTLYVAGLEQGKWAVEGFTWTGARAATRTSDVRSFQQGGEPERRALADLEAMAETAGSVSTRGLVPVPPEVSQPRWAAPAWTYLTPAGPARWHEADSGQPVYVDSQTGGHPQISGGGITQLTRAAAMWRNASSLNALVGVFRGPRCFSNAENDGRISVTYGDPCGEIADGSSTLAYGGMYFTGGNDRVINGVVFRKAFKGMVVTDNVASKFQNMSLGCYEQMLAHELGHAIGFGHSTSPSAIMYPTIGSCSGRTTSNPLSADELAGLAAIYPGMPGMPPSAPLGLVASASAAGISASWQPPSSGPVSDYVLEAGSTPGSSNLGMVNTGLQTSFSTPAPPGQYFLRVRARSNGAAGPPSAEVSVVVPSATPPSPPSGLVATVAGSMVTLQWNAPGAPAPTGYLVEAGSAPGLANLASMPVAGASLTVSGVPPGTYFVRVRAIGPAGAGAASNEVQVVVGAGVVPGSPTGLSAVVSGGGTVALSWIAPGTGGAPTGYLLEAGSSPGLNNLATVNLGTSPAFATTGVDAGTYYVRVRALNTAGAGSPSAEIVVVVP